MEVPQQRGLWNQRPTCTGRPAEGRLIERD